MTHLHVTFGLKLGNCRSVDCVKLPSTLVGAFASRINSSSMVLALNRASSALQFSSAVRFWNTI